MAQLIVEDGSIVPNANSYVSIEYADEYNEIYGDEAWSSYEEDQKTKALILATQALDQLYGPRYVSIPLLGTTQELYWPRMGFRTKYNNKYVNSNQIPNELKKATCVVAMMQLNGADLTPSENNEGYVTSESVSVDVVSQSRTYSQPLNVPLYEGFRPVDLILEPILTSISTSNQGGNWRKVT